MRFNLLSQEEGLPLAEEGGDGLRHLSEFTPSPLFKGKAPEISSYTLGRVGAGVGQENGRHLSSLVSFPARFSLPIMLNCWSHIS